jgi:OOP family OmpA-OmpF porin
VVDISNQQEEKSMRKISYIPWLLLLSLFWGMSVSAELQESEGILAQLNKKLTELKAGLSQAQVDQVHYLSPQAFEKAMQNLEEAEEDLQKGRNVKGISKKVSIAEEQLALSLDNAKEARKQLPTLIQSRDDAIAAEAHQYAVDIYEEAEKLFTDAMQKIEKMDVNGAIKRGKQAEEKFRDAELAAIKASIIGSVHDLLEKARDVKADKFAPATYERSQILIGESENILNSNRQAQTTAREKAQEAEYEARHAIYLSTLIQDTRKDDKNWEQYILSVEKAIDQVSDEFGMKSRFHRGFEEPLNALHLAVTALKQDKQELTRELAESNAETGSLREQIKSISSELDESKQQEAGLKAKLEAEKRQEDKIKGIENLFTSSEAIVLREGTNLVLRLVGLSFESGKSEIDAQYFSLLTKVQRAIREFPDAGIIVEGHTDSRGNDIANMRLSQERARAVMSYLKANMELADERIRAVGYGKNKPIASNETEVDRKKNRRIDLVLEIGEAVY